VGRPRTVDVEGETARVRAAALEPGLEKFAQYVAALVQAAR
jgi:hypothetical protein